MKRSEFISSDDRVEIAHQISKARRNEVGERKGKEFYGIDRTGKEFLCRIGGLEHLFKYARSLNSNVILDIGTGTGKASRAISRMAIASGFDYHVSALRNTPELLKRFPKDKIHITGAETLRGIQNNSTGVILGLNSLGYSVRPRIVAQRLNEVLVAGGVIKGTFNTIGGFSKYGESEIRDPQTMGKYLSEMGYDVSFKDFGFYVVGVENVGPFLSNAILVAIKPGKDHISAEKMLYDDVGSLRMQAIHREYGGDTYNIADDPE
jgi:hypothetical protein